MTGASFHRCILIRLARQLLLVALSGFSIGITTHLTKINPDHARFLGLG